MAFKSARGAVVAGPSRTWRRAWAAGVVAALALAAGCAGVPPASEADAARAHTSVAALEQGRALYLDHCSACHTPPAPSSQPVTAWPGHVDEMQIRAHLTPHEASLVVQYLTTVASR